MPDPAQLLQVAQLLLREGNGETLLTYSAGDAHRRRAVSTAYYALFHLLVGAASLEFVGSHARYSTAFSIIYRGFQHRRMKDVCKAVQTPTLRTDYRNKLRRDFVSQEMRDVASAFTKLQEQRHLADYDPTAIFLSFDVSALVDAAADAIQAFGQVPADERRDVLALMLIDARG